MSAEIGHYALIISLVIAVLQSVIPLWGLHRNDAAATSFAATAAIAQFLFISIAFGCLTYAFVVSDFSVETVVANSHTAKPLLYKFSGVWANHEGSMLLWVLILSLFGAALAFDERLQSKSKACVLAVQGMVGTAFLAFVAFTSNPFQRVWPPPSDGMGINPILQDPGLALHPPFLYLGYVGFSIVFSFAVAALIEGRADAQWARHVRPWVLAAWSFLTVGITLGSAWAYYTLGWGGWWFWDPVENASFMPWLLGTALLHSVLVLERRNAFASWTILLGILAFSLSLVGTFLVRSGVLTSVHAFAVDPARGVFVLAIIVAATGGALALYAVRAHALQQGDGFAVVSRESALAANNMLIVVAAGTVLLGTFYPLLIDILTTDKISVGPPYYNRTFVPLIFPLLLLMVAGPRLNWKRASLRQALSSSRAAAIAGCATMFAIAAFTLGSVVITVPILGLAAMLIVAPLVMLIDRIGLGRAPLSASATAARRLPPSVYGLVLAHAGVGVLVAGIATNSTWQSERVLMMRPGETAILDGYSFRFEGVKNMASENYTAEQGRFAVSVAGRPLSLLASERRYFAVRRQQTTSAGIDWGALANLYVALGEPDQSGAWTVRLYHHPLVSWIWIGGFMMAAGGFAALADRRSRRRSSERDVVAVRLAPAE